MRKKERKRERQGDRETGREKTAKLHQNFPKG